jgi:chromosome segregation ATPase
VAIEAERERADEAQSRTARVVAEKRRSVPAFEHRMPELDRELREVNKLFAELLAVQPPTPQVKHEIIRLRERIVAIPNEKNDLRMLHLRAANELRMLEEQHDRERAVLEGVERRERELAAAFKRADHELAEQIRELERQRAVLEREFQSLEKAKANPYRELGRVLADNGIAPMNQPQALEAAQRRRLVVQEQEYQHALSLAATAKENPRELRASLWLWGGLAVTAAGFIAALLALA